MRDENELDGAVGRAFGLGWESGWRDRKGYKR
jgi:hypothetical protein